MLVDTARWIDTFLNAGIAYLIYHFYLNKYLNNTEESYFYFYLTVFILITLYLGLKKIDHYENLGTGTIQRNYVSLWITITFSFGIPLFLLFLIKATGTVSRVWLLSWMSSAYVILLITQYFWRWLFRVCAEHGHCNRTVILVGCSQAFQHARDFLSEASQSTEIRLLSTYEFRSSDRQNLNEEDQLLFSRVLRDCRANAVDEVVIALSVDSPALLDRIIKTVKLLPAEVSIFFDHGGQDVKLHGVKNLGDLQTVSIQRPPISDWGRLAKFLTDYSISAATLLALLPLILLIAIAIKFDSRGPVFFRQRRQGFNGKVINILKFRTMTALEDGDHVRQAQKNDQRVTRVGRILRRTSLDELPQLLNVLGGDMSVVGPRPHAIAHNNYYERLLENYANRYRVKPGITGWAQIKGFRGETTDQNQMESRIQFDLEYIDNWSFFMDIYIILVTPLCCLVSRNAY